MPPAEPSPRASRMTAGRWCLLVLLVSAVAILLFGMMLPGKAIAFIIDDIAPVARLVRWLERIAPLMDLVHVVLFAWITLCLRWLFPRLRTWQVVLWALALAAGSELMQLLAPGRRPGLYDVGQDLLGVSIGLVLGWVLRAVLPKPASPPPRGSSTL